LQIYDRDSSTTEPTVVFLALDSDLSEFLVSRMAGTPGVLYLAGATPADLEHHKVTGERLAGVRIR
jgi:hypothetical protein